MSIKPITAYHAHVYFDADSRAEADALKERVADTFAPMKIALGRSHDKPVGPHPRGSFQIAFPAALFAPVIEWLIQNRGNLTVFAHGISGDDWTDHTQHVFWLGESEALNLSIFEQITKS